jgi:hypothetical protein
VGILAVVAPTNPAKSSGLTIKEAVEVDLNLSVTKEYADKIREIITTGNK